MKKELLNSGHEILVFGNKNNRVTGVGMTEEEFIVWVKENSVEDNELLIFFAEIIHNLRQAVKVTFAVIVFLHFLQDSMYIS